MKTQIAKAQSPISQRQYHKHRSEFRDSHVGSTSVIDSDLFLPGSKFGLVGQKNYSLFPIENIARFARVEYVALRVGEGV